jgi:colicin import membrane protein
LPLRCPDKENNLRNWMPLVLFLPALALAQDIGRPATIGAPAVPQTHSVEQADDKLRKVKQDRDATEAEYAAAEQVCYKKFFVNHCLDIAKEKRRARLADLRAIENEANYFKRRHSVEMRDRELEDRAQKDAAEAAYRAANPAPVKANPADRPPPKPAPVSLEQRAAEHAAKERERQAREAADVPKRAANVAEYERKKAEAERRQADVAKKKAEKEEKRRKRAESAKPAAAPVPPPAAQ